MGMHNFGERRWKTGIIDDVRSLTDQNTRIVGDFTKMLRVLPIAEKMYQEISEDHNWQTHFDMLIENSPFPELNELDSVVSKIQLACFEFADDAKNFRRDTVQTRFFETGDNFYLGESISGICYSSCLSFVACSSYSHQTYRNGIYSRVR